MRKLRALWIRLRGIFGSERANRDFATELESHLAMHIDDGVRSGLSREEARRQALIRLGGLEQVNIAHRERRRLPTVESFAQDVRYGLRLLTKSPGFVCVSVATLALGIGANTAIFSVVKTVLLAALPYPEPDRIVAVWTVSPARGNQPLASTPGDFAIWKQKSGVFEDLAPSYDDEMTLTGEGAPQLLFGYGVSANYLRILGAQPQLGRLYTDDEDKPKGPNVALLSDHLWRTKFHSDPSVVGSAITLEGKPYTVLGVMPRDFGYPPTVEIWTPAS